MHDANIALAPPGCKGYIVWAYILGVVMPNTQPISIRVPFKLLAQLRAHAKSKGLTLTAYLLQSAAKEMENGN